MRIQNCHFSRTDPFIVVAGIHHESQADLPGVTQATRLLSADFSLAQRGQQHGGQNRNDGNHHQQFYQGKTSAGRAFWNFHIVSPMKHGPANEPS
jgi:hypothetical protein